MTVIAGVVDGVNVFLSSDGAATAGTDQWHISRSKLMRYQVPCILASAADLPPGTMPVTVPYPLLLGASGPVRLCQLLQHRFVPPICDFTRRAAEGYLVAEFVDALFAFLKDERFARHGEDADEALLMDAEFLVAFQGGLYELGANGTVVEAEHNYAAVGCGAAIARGSLYTSAGHRGTTPRQRLLVALRAASYHSSDVAPPFFTERLAPESELVEYAEEDA